MTITHSYEKELESLILDQLLPAFVKLHSSLGNKDPLAGINSRLLKQVIGKKRLAALLRPIENCP